MIDNMKKQVSRKAKDTIILKSGAVVKLTPNQKAYADTKLENPNMPLTEVVKRAYPNVKDSNVASTIAALNDKNKDLQIYTGEQVNKAKKRIVELIDSEREDISLRASVDVLDREHGKAVQQVQTTSRVMTISIDLTNGLVEPQTEG